MGAVRLTQGEMQAAADTKTMKAWGLSNVHLESWPFGRGWQNVIVASFAYNTANRDEKLPRKPLPNPTPAAGRGTTSSQP